MINSFGVLPSFFNYAKSVFIGKSLIESLKQEGGQSPIEAAKLGCFIYHGKYVYNFQEIYKILHQNNISKEISSYDELANLIIKDFMKTKEKEKSLKLFNDLGDKFQFEQSMRQFYSTANTRVPNNQKDFAQFCYGNMASCKEGDEFMCEKNSGSIQ